MGTQAVRRDTLLKRYFTWVKSCHCSHWRYCEEDEPRHHYHCRSQRAQRLHRFKPACLFTLFADCPSITHSSISAFLTLKVWRCLNLSFWINSSLFIRVLILFSLKLEGTWMGATLPWFTLMSSSFKHQMTKLDRENKWSEMSCTITSCICLPTWHFTFYLATQTCMCRRE